MHRHRPSSFGEYFYDDAITMQYIEPHTTTYFECQDVVVGDSTQAVWSPLEKNISYFNHLNDDVIVVGRDGLPFRLPPSGKRDNVFQVRITYRINSSVAIDPKGVFHQYGSSSSEGKALAAAIRNSEENNPSGNKSFCLDYTVERDDIARLGGVLYLAELDIVISVHKDEWKALHPYSDAATRYQIIEAESNVNNSERFGYSVYLVSNDEAVKDKYINIGGSVYRVPSIVNQSLRDGVYVCSSGPVQNGAKDPIPMSLHYTFEEAWEDLRLYDSAEEADKLGDVLGEREKEIKELQLRYKELEHDHKMERMKHDQDMEEKRREYENLTLDRERESTLAEHERSLRSLREKDFYESRSAVRKDSSEVVKYAPVILTSMFAIAAFIMKSKK